MQYILTFIEGLISFISPCLLPMLPVYMTYFAGSGQEESQTKTLKNAVGFVLGFSAVFISLGLFAGKIGSFIIGYSTAFNIITGSIVIFFALGFLGVFSLPFLHIPCVKLKSGKPGFFSAFLFGTVFSVSLTPCIGAFLGAALMQASREGSAAKGAVMLLLYSMGLGIPFIFSALLINRLKGAFDFIIKHYRVIKTASGCFLIIVGILMMTGYMSVITSLLR